MIENHSRSRVAVCLSILLGINAQSVVADEVVDDLIEISLEDLLNIKVVSATRSESKLSESPVPISVITAKEIASSGLDSIPEVLSRLGEVDVLRVGRSQPEVSIRGKGITFNRRLLVLIDGRTEYNDLFGVTFWEAFPVSVDDIERIEVVRGPASALFGANAFSGVINVITKQADSEHKNIARAHAGSNQLQYAHLRWHKIVEDFSIQLAVGGKSHDNSENLVVFPGFNRLPTTSDFNNDDESLDMTRANFQLKYRASDHWRNSLNVGMSDGDYEFIVQPGLPRSDWSLKNNNFHVKSQYDLSDSTTLEFNAYWIDFEYDTPLLPTTDDVLAISLIDGRRFYPSFDTGIINSGQVDTVNYSLQFVGNAMEKSFNWVAGAEYREIENKGGLVLDSKKDIASGFANFTYKWGDNQWLAGLGVRVDDDSTVGENTGYNASLSYFIDQRQSIRITARSAFRAPSLFEQFSNIDFRVPMQNQQVRFRGNDLLEVEEIDSLDLTYTTQINDRMQLTLEYFQEEYNGLIGNPDSGLLEDIEFDPDTNTFITTTTFRNLANAENSGFLVSLRWLASDKFSSWANYTYNDPEGLNDLTGETFFTPESKVSLGGNWKLTNRVNFDFSFHWVDKTDDSEFSVGDIAVDGPNFTRNNQQAYNYLNFRLSYKAEFAEGLELYLAGNNVFDDEHVEYYEFDTVLNAAGEQFGSELWGGFSWKF